MSRKIEVKEYNSLSSHHVKRSIAECLVARLLAQWVVPDVVIRMLPPSIGLQRLQYLPSVVERERNSYMERSDGLPSLELPGLSFELRGKKMWDGAPTRKWLQEQSVSNDY
jgi:hypothetical protein